MNKTWFIKIAEQFWAQKLYKFLCVVGVLVLFLAACVKQEKIVTVPSTQDQVITQKTVPLSDVPGVTIETCDKAINAVSYVACVDTVVLKQGDPSLCDEITRKYPAAYTIGDHSAAYNRDVCIFSYVDQTNDKTPCKDIADEELRFSCLNNLR